MLVSYIIPVYEPDMDLFRKCITAFKKQSYKNFEAIVVLDGPCEAAREVVTELGDKRISVVGIAHSGVQKARNHGATLAKGDILSFWDGDSVTEPDTCKTWIDTFKANPDIAFVYSGYKFVDERGGITSEPFDPWTLKCGNYISTMFPMRRDFFPGFDETLKSLQDWDMWLTIVENGGKGLFIPGYAFSTAFPTAKSISGQGCTDQWLERVRAIKVKHNLPDRKVCVASVGHKEEGIRLAKLIDADYKDVPNNNPNKYESIIQVGFSLHPVKAKQHSAIFNQKLKKKIIFWTFEDITEIQNAISLKALTTYAAYLNPHVIQYVEDMEALKIMQRAGFNVSIMPMPMVNTDAIEAMPTEPRILVDTTEDYRQIFQCLEYSLPDIKFDVLDKAKPINQYNAILTLNTERTIPFTVKRMLLAGRNVIGNIQNPFCGYVDDNQEPGKYIPAMVEHIRARINKPAGPATRYWAEQMAPTKLMEVLK